MPVLQQLQREATQPDTRFEFACIGERAQDLCVRVCGDCVRCMELATRNAQEALAREEALGTHPGRLAQAERLWPLFRGIVADVPFVDVLNTMWDKDLPLTPPEWPEWGNPIESREAHDYIASYSPYDNVTAQDYPPLFISGGLNDPRVTYWEPAKWVAKLRELKTDANELISKTNMGAGHGGKSGRFDSLREDTEAYAFVLTQMP